MTDYIPPDITKPFKTSLHSAHEITKFLQDYAYLRSIDDAKAPFHTAVARMTDELNDRLPLGFEAHIDENPDLHADKGCVKVHIYNVAVSRSDPVIILRPEIRKFFDDGKRVVSAGRKRLWELDTEDNSSAHASSASRHVYLLADEEVREIEEALSGATKKRNASMVFSFGERNSPVPDHLKIEDFAACIRYVKSICEKLNVDFDEDKLI